VGVRRDNPGPRPVTGGDRVDPAAMKSTRPLLVARGISTPSAYHRD
jgi:hypothetical protein